MKQHCSEGIRAATTVALTLVILALIVGLIWNWVMALAFIIGGTFFAVCCFLSYYRHIASAFDNIADTNQSYFLAFFVRNIAQPETPRSGSEMETFKPFTFKQESDKDLEDMRARALLRQVFPDGEVM